MRPLRGLQQILVATREESGVLGFQPQGVQLCYGPSTYSPVGSLDPAPSLEAPGPGFPAYPTEDFPSQVRAGETAEVPHPLIEVPGTASEPEHIGNP